MKTIGLNMIVKNESKVIARMLKSVRPIIDSFCICDTGSTDNTVEVIEEFARENGIQGTVVRTTFIDFEKSRSEALDAARKAMPEVDYILLMDADMVLRISPEFDKDALKEDVINLRQGNAGFHYENPRLVRTTLPCRYAGVTHEYLNIEVPHHTKGTIESLFIEDIGDGGCKDDKYVRDIRLLLQGIKDHPNSERYHFYLANSYHDTGRNAEAIEYYKKRIAFGGWAEEVFYSMYRICICARRMGDADQCLLYGMKAWMFRPTRAESIHELMQFYREAKQYTLAVALYELVKDLPVPKDSLFVHAALYEYQLHNEYSLAAFYAGRREGVFPAYKHLFAHLDVYAQFNNYKFYVPRPHGIRRSLACQHTLDGMVFRGSSPSLVAMPGNQYLVNVRLVNYRIQPNGGYVYPDGLIATRNKRLVLSEQLEVLEETILGGDHAKRPFPGSSDSFLSGVEDVKLSRNSNGLVYYTGTTVHMNPPQIGVCFGVYGDELRPTDLKNLADCEKNWVLVPGARGRVVYKWQPLTLGNIRGEGLELEPVTRAMPKLFEQARGSTNGVEHDGAYWFVVHFVHKYGDEPRFYYHALAVFDKDMKLLRYCMPFKFTESPIEYCLGLVVEKARILLGFSVNDDDAQIGVYPHDAFHFVNV